MNIKQALQVPISLVLGKLNARFSHRSNQEDFFYSPFRQEEEPSLRVYILENVWYDKIEKIGGDILKLVAIHLQRRGEEYQEADVLRWFEDLAIDESVDSFGLFKGELISTRLVLKDKYPIKKLALKRFLRRRGIPVKQARHELVEILVEELNSGKVFYALGFVNDDDGWDVRNSFFTGNISPATVSFIKGTQTTKKEIHVFQNYIDYLSRASHFKNGKRKGDTIILNSLPCVPLAYPFINMDEYKLLYSWFDNDDCGKTAQATLDEFVKSKPNLKHQPMNKLYAEHKNVNDWHVYILKKYTKEKSG